MTDTQDQAVSEAGRALVAKRWGSPSPVLSRAVQTVSDRRDELDGPLLDKLRAVVADDRREGT